MLLAMDAAASLTKSIAAQQIALETKVRQGHALTREELLWLFTLSLANKETRQDLHYGLPLPEIPPS
jgi:hypothetical protein